MSYTPGRVSVLIPLFNRAKYIRDTIDSVLQQDYEGIELICVDDGSTDGGDKILEEYAARQEILLLRHEGHKNKGQSASLNLALQRATGEFIAILDSDDLFAPGKISKQVEYLNAHKDIGLVYGNGKAIDADANFLYDITYDDQEEKSDPNEILLDCYFLLPQNSLVRSDIYRLAGMFDETLRAAQDHDMLIRLAEHTKIAHISIDGFRYRRHADSISVKGAEARWRAGLVILAKAAARYPYKSRTLKKRRAVINFRLALALIGAKKSWVEASWCLVLSALLDPLRALRVLFRIEKIS